MSNYCHYLFKNLYIQKLDQSNIKLAYCCLAKTSDPLQQIDFNNDFLDQGRNHFIKTGELPNECQYCVDIESTGGESQRINLLKTLGSADDCTASLETLHYNCDPICNLKCITCNHEWSSAWIEDAISLGMRTSNKILPTKHNSLIWNLNLKKLKSIYFNGGEPLLTRDHINLIQKLKQTVPSTKNIMLIYNTNSTCQVTDEIVNLWKDFHSVGLMCSIDAIGEPLEYIRFPANWTQVSSNILSYQKLNFKELHLKITPNIGVHNVFYLEDLINWSINHQIPLDYHPTGGLLSILNFPLHLIESLIDHLTNLQNEYKSIIDLQPLIKMSYSINNPDLYWIKFLTDLDKLRNNNWHNSLSRLYDLDPKFFNSWSG